MKNTSQLIQEAVADKDRLIIELKKGMYETTGAYQRLQKELGETNEALAACQSQAAGKIQKLEDGVMLLEAVLKEQADGLDTLRKQAVELMLQIAGKEILIEAYRAGKVEDGQARLAAIRIAGVEES